MELDEVRERLVVFLRAQLDDPAAMVVQLEPGPGHAGFSYLFDVLSPRTGGSQRYFMRLPPPNVKWEGTADVLRQVLALNALEGSGVPHAPVIWSGDDLRWFGCPYFIQPRIEGQTLAGGYATQFTPAQRTEMARQAMTALAGIHRIDWREKASGLGDFWGFELDVTRWDRFYERAEERQSLALQPVVRQKLLDRVPGDARIGLCHGDFQWTNLMYSPEARLLAVIDWELTGIGATLSDVGWISMFSDPRAWAQPLISPCGDMPLPDELEAFYREASGAALPAIRWFRALAAYKFAIITGFNLMLHRRGRRLDPHWEEIAPSMRTNMAYADMMLSS